MSSIKHSPRTRAFLDALMALCRRHGLHLTIDDGAFAVEPLTSNEQLEPVSEARDDVRGFPITEKLGLALGDDGLPARMRKAADTAGNVERVLLQKGAEEVVSLRRGLALAIAEADRWYAEAQDADGLALVIATPEMDALRSLLPPGAMR